MELPDVRPDAARLLEPVYRSLNDVRNLVEVLEVRLGGASPQDRLPLLEEISNLRETLGQKDLAFAARMRAFGEMPESAEAREQLERLAAETGALRGAGRGATRTSWSAASPTPPPPSSGGGWRCSGPSGSTGWTSPSGPTRSWRRREPRNMAVLDALARIHSRAGDAQRAGLGDEADGDGRAVAAEADRPAVPAGDAGRGDALRQAAGRAVLRGDPRPQAGRRRRDQVPGQGAHRERALARAGLAHRPGDPARRLHRTARGDVRPDGPPGPAPPGSGCATRAGALDIFEDVLRREAGARRAPSARWRRWRARTARCAARRPRPWSPSSPPAETI